MAEVNMEGANAERPAPMGGGPPPPSISHSGSGHPSPGHPSPPYLAARSAKHPAPQAHYGQPGGYYGGHGGYHAPAESRYPPSTARHDEYQRHPPPPAHYAPHGYHHTAGPPSGAAAVIKPHPADRFGKTITVSGRTDIADPPAGAPRHDVPATVHSPRGAPSGAPHGAPVAHFSPSRGGAFRPYLKPEATAASGGRRPPEIVEGGSSELETDEEVRAATENGAEATDEESKEGAKEGSKQGTKEETGGEDGAQDQGMKSVTHSSSMDTSEPKEATKEAAAPAEEKAKGGEFQQRLKPAPISTKRPRSRNGPEANVDDDTPKHVNVRPAGFQCPTKRSKLSDEGHGYAHPPSGHEEGRQDRLSQAPSAHSLEIRDSWLHPGEKTPTEYPEPASYLPTGSLSWEVPAGTLSAIGSTLSFGNAAGGQGGGGQGQGGFLAPRPSANSKLFEPPPPAAPRGGKEERTLEPRGNPAGAAREGAPGTRDKYAPTTVHDPRRAHHYPQERRDPYQEGRYGGCERRDAHESPGRHGHYGSDYNNAPWTSPPRSHAPALPPLHDTSHHTLSAPGGLSLGAGSFESKGSFRSLEEPMDLLCRASFSWETGLPGAAPSGYGQPQQASGHSGHPRPASGPQGGYAGYGPPLPAPSSYHAPFPHHQAPQDHAVHLAHQQKILRALALRNELRTIGDPASPHQGLLLLLALPHDRHCLSETLCIVRNNIEVFTATLDDVNAPAPGRKRPIQLGQVGLRCVYCRMAPPKSRIKRATCFPSSVKRIYRAVIDMKLDHFRHCPHVPDGLKARLDELKQGSTRSTGTTVQYFVRGAEEMGMRDNGEDGVGIDLRRVSSSGPEGPMAPYPKQVPPQRPVRARPLGPPGGPPQSYGPTTNYHSAPAFQAANAALGHPGVHPPNVPPPRRYSGRALLSLPSDSSVLSPLRCFLRKHVVAFAATDSDASIRSPSTFAVRPGQVGVGCVHCLAADPKARSNRAVCFPFSMSRIYQSVADIQRFHLGECRALPAQVKEEFLQLQKESAKGSKGLATRSYWIESARRIGLADGPNGMYFCRDPSLPPRPEPRQSGGGDNLGLLARAASGEDSLGQLSLVTPDDRPTIAAFLYRVMEQLRPTRFSEADRNKRRSKDVGSIGVECRHCAGKIDGRKFFWSSVSAAESNFVSVHSHVLGCPHVPLALREELAGLKELRREQTSRLRVGSQKAFFERVWARLHGLPVPPIEDPQGKGGKKKAGKGSSKKKTKAAKAKAPDEPALDLQQTNSEEVRAILESKSTLSSMPSLDESVTAFPSELTARGDEVAEKKIVSQGSKGSLSTVARDMSAVSVRCMEEEEETADADAKIAEV